MKKGGDIKMKEQVGEVSITGNVICPHCGRWTGKNAQIDKPPYKCVHCGTLVVLLPRQEKYYKNLLENED